MANHAGLEKSVVWPSRRWNARRNPACQQMPHSASRMSAKTTVELVKSGGLPLRGEIEDPESQHRGKTGRRHQQRNARNPRPQG